MLLWFILSISLSDAYASLADDYLDSVLGDPLKQAVKAMNLEPAPLPDLEIPFTYRLGLIPIKGKVNFSNGVFNGLSKIRRFAECEGPSFSIQEVKLECTMNFFGISAVYDGSAKVEQIPPIPFQVTAYVNETLVKSGASGAPATLTARITLLEITKLGDINVKFSNLGIFQYVYDAVEEELREEIKKETERIILRQFPMAFSKALTTIRLPGLAKNNNE